MNLNAHIQPQAAKIRPFMVVDITDISIWKNEPTSRHETRAGAESSAKAKKDSAPLSEFAVFELVSVAAKRELPPIPQPARYETVMESVKPASPVANQFPYDIPPYLNKYVIPNLTGVYGKAAW